MRVGVSVSVEALDVVAVIIAGCIMLRALFGVTLKTTFAIAAVVALSCAAALMLDLNDLANTLGAIAFLTLLVSAALVLLEGSAFAKHLYIFNKPLRPILRR